MKFLEEKRVVDKKIGLDFSMTIGIAPNSLWSHDNPRITKPITMESLMTHTKVLQVSLVYLTSQQLSSMISLLNELGTMVGYYPIFFQISETNFVFAT